MIYGPRRDLLDFRERGMSRREAVVVLSVCKISSQERGILTIRCFDDSKSDRTWHLKQAKIEKYIAAI
jgi:hypothetical protein